MRIFSDMRGLLRFGRIGYGRRSCAEALQLSGAVLHEREHGTPRFGAPSVSNRLENPSMAWQGRARGPWQRGRGDEAGCELREDGSRHLLEEIVAARAQDGRVETPVG